MRDWNAREITISERGVGGSPPTWLHKSASKIVGCTATPGLGADWGGGFYFHGTVGLGTKSWRCLGLGSEDLALRETTDNLFKS